MICLLRSHLFRLLLLNSFVLILSDNSCKIDKVEIPILPSRIILTFECYSGTDYNPIIPIDNGSHSSEYNELDLSPNLFATLPVAQLCPFVNIYLLDLSRNQIKSLRYAFKSLSCLISLKRFDLSYNSISTPLVDSDFSDEFAQHIEYLNLKNNHIPSIDTKVFFRNDGTSRFPSLYYLDLSNNLIKAIDLLWPMTLRHPSAKIILSNNKISTIKNQLRLSYDNKVFQDVIGDRVVDLSNNELTHLDDSNLLQYNLQNQADFERFITKLSNFDFSNNRFNCLCPNKTGLFTVYWFKVLAQRIADFSAPIFQVYCAQTFQDNNVFDFECQFAELPPPDPPTQPIIPFNLLFRNITHKIPTKNASIVTPTKNFVASSFYISRYWLFLLALIPLVVLSIMLFVFCCGRCFLINFHRNFSVNLCACLRQDEDEQFSASIGKMYDSLILYTLNDQNFLEEKFMPSFALFNKGYKVIKLPIDSNFLMSKGHQECMKACKRVVILITTSYLNKEWNNQLLRNAIKDVSNDTYSKVLLVNAEDVPYLKIEQYIEEIQLANSKNDLWQTPSRFARFKRRLANKIKYNCSLSEIETIDWQDKDFWAKFAYTMPMLKNPEKPTEIIQYTQKLADSLFQQTSSTLNSTNTFYADYNTSLLKKKEEPKLVEPPIPGLNKKLPEVSLFKSAPNSHRMCAKLFQQNETSTHTAEVINTEFVEKDDFWTKFETFKNETKKNVYIPDEIINKLSVRTAEQTAHSTPVASSRATPDTNFLEKILGPIREKTVISSSSDSPNKTKPVAISIGTPDSSLNNDETQSGVSADFKLKKYLGSKNRIKIIS